jgi:hypothetical protein
MHAWEAGARRLMAALLVSAALVACASREASVRPTPENASAVELPESEPEALKPVSPPPEFFALPVEFEGDWGAANGDALLIRFLPLYKLPLSEEWELVNLDLVTLADAPDLPSVPGDPTAKREFGLSDWVHASILEKRGQSPLILGLGANIGLPTATADALGTGKWTAGPAFRVTYRGDHWNLGVVGIQRWSFAGSSKRAEVNQLLMRGAIRRKIADDWFFVSAPIITANWKAPSGQRWLVPLGGGVGRVFSIGDRPWSASVQAYYNVVRPDGAPDWSLRFSIVLALPL